MGVVWKGEDTVLGRTVAIKFLPPDVAQDDGPRRKFLDEARLASSLSDAHIAQVHEFVRDGDLDFIVMEYVKGQPLSRILDDGRLPPKRIVSIGVQIASAVARAHSNGLIHRDIKPANVVVGDNDEVKVVDFGIARLFASTSAPPATDEAAHAVSAVNVGERLAARSSQRSVLGGTLPYMSPEQIRGLQLDARTDIFSLGVVLYEMSTGRMPFAAATAVATIEAILGAAPVRPRTIVPDLPRDLERIILKALAKDRRERHQTMQDVSRQFRRLGSKLGPRGRFVWVVSISVLILVAFAGTARWVVGPPSPAPDPPAVLVMPLEVRGQPDGAEYVGRAFSEALAVSLAQAVGLRVLAVPEVPMSATGDPARLQETARSLGANRVITGTLVRSTRTSHATLTLLDTASRRVLWSVDREVAGPDLSSLASWAAGEIAQELGARVPPKYGSIMGLMSGRTVEGSVGWSRAIAAIKRDDLVEALVASDELLRQFPGEPAALILRAWAEGIAFDRDPSVERRDAARDAVEAARRADPENPYVEICQGQVAWIEGRPREMIDRATRVLNRTDLMPDARAWILSRRALALRACGDSGAALLDLETGFRLDPTNAALFVALSGALRDVGRLEEAATRAHQAIALEPTSASAHSYLGLALSRADRWTESLPSFETACQLGHNQEACAFFANGLLHAGEVSKARNEAAAASRLPASIWGAYNLACYEARAGHIDSALAHLQRSYELGFANALIVDDPNLAPLRGEPSFEAIVAKVKGRLGRN
jgi:tetratricopeptide (TPR) repeat protein/TolB-like protein/predicted Ser/Thr protein kinase